MTRKFKTIGRSMAVGFPGGNSVAVNERTITVADDFADATAARLLLLAHTQRGPRVAKRIQREVDRTARTATAPHGVLRLTVARQPFNVQAAEAEHHAIGRVHFPERLGGVSDGLRQRRPARSRAVQGEARKEWSAALGRLRRPTRGRDAPPVS